MSQPFPMTIDGKAVAGESCKWSGIGYENGPYGLAAFTELQTINVAKG